MILIICAWVYHFLLGLALGAGSLRLISRIAGKSVKLECDIFYQFWFGFVVLIGLLQLLSLFLPMGNVTFIAISLLGVLFAALHIKNAVNSLRSFFRWLTTVKGFISFLMICLILVLVAYSANKEINHTDTFIYHFNAVKWAKEYPVVPGLVNLHNRLGFNSSFFLFAAFTEIGPYTGQSAHLALSFMMTVCLVHWFRIISDPAQVMVKRIFCMMTFVFLIIHTSFRMDINSLSTDYPMAVLTLVFCLVLLDRLPNKTILLLPLSAAIFSFKLSGMLVVGVALLILTGYFFKLRFDENKDRSKKKQEVKILISSFLLLFLIACGFVVRNVIVSGWLVYPFPIGNMHLPWSVPKDYVLDMIDWIKSYPKIPGGASPETIRNNDFSYWFMKWLSNFKQSFEFNMAAWSFFILLWSAFQISSFPKFAYARLNILLLILFSVASIIFWFISAPDIRFGSVYFFILFAGSIVLLYEGSRYRNILKVFIYIIFISQVIGQIPGYYADRNPNLFTFAYTPPVRLNRVVASPPDENPPLYIYMPAEGNQCGDSPIPCTPYAGGLLHNHQVIRQRVPGDLSKGFLPPVR